MFVLSSFLDNIAAALIGGTMARHVFRGKVHIGYLAGIVAASNAGGSGVVGDTTTTMMWIDGVSPLSCSSLCRGRRRLPDLRHPGGDPAAPLFADPQDAPRGLQIDWTSLVIVALILVIAIVANVTANLRYPALLDMVPVIGLAVWIVILATAALRRPDWEIMPETFKGTIFLLALVTNASLMPVEGFRWPRGRPALGLGFLSSVFDNIPLTALALKRAVTTGASWLTQSASAAR